MKLEIPYQVAKDGSEAFDLVKEKLDPSFLSQFKLKIKVEFNKEKGVIEGIGKGFKASFIFQEDRCLVEISLSFLLKPLSSKISKDLEDGLRNLL